MSTILFHFRQVKRNAAFAAGLILTPINLVPIANGTIGYRVEGTRRLFAHRVHAESYAVAREQYLERIDSRRRTPSAHIRRGPTATAGPMVVFV